MIYFAACRCEGVHTLVDDHDETVMEKGICAAHATALQAEAFENHLKAHPEEVGRLTGETQ